MRRTNRQEFPLIRRLLFLACAALACVIATPQEAKSAIGGVCAVGVPRYLCGHDASYPAGGTDRARRPASRTRGLSAASNGVDLLLADVDLASILHQDGQGLASQMPVHGSGVTKVQSGSRGEGVSQLLQSM